MNVKDLMNSKVSRKSLKYLSNKFHQTVRIIGIISSETNESPIQSARYWSKVKEISSNLSG